VRLICDIWAIRALDEKLAAGRKVFMRSWVRRCLGMVT
jgi:hypothetical protein